MAKIERVLVGLDGSPLAELALPYAEALAGAGGLPLVLVRILPAAEASDEPAQAAETYLAGIAQRLVGQGLIVETSLLTGPPAETLATMAADATDSLLVLATHGRSGLGRWVFGSVAQGVLAVADVPVLLVRAWEPRRPLIPPGRPPRILVPLDGSRFAEAALPWAIQLARMLKGEVALVSVLDLLTPATAAAAAAWGVLPADLPQDDEKLATTYLNGVVAQLQAEGIPAERSVVVDYPAPGIVAAADAADAALIAMATHGRSRLAGSVLGSVALAVLHRGHLPVLFVRPAPE
jgi:nucleotide-binding universal stress UspA family protein